MLDHNIAILINQVFSLALSCPQDSSFMVFSFLGHCQTPFRDGKSLDMTHSLYHIKGFFHITNFRENYKPGRMVTVLPAESLLSSRHIPLPDVRATARDRTANGCEVPGTSNGILLLNVFIKQTAFYQALAPYPQDKTTILLTGKVTQLVNTDSRIRRSLF